MTSTIAPTITGACEQTSDGAVPGSDWRGRGGGRGGWRRAMEGKQCGEGRGEGRGPGRGREAGVEGENVILTWSETPRSMKLL